MHCRLGSATLSQLAFPMESNPNFPWEKSQWGKTVFKKKKLQGCTPCPSGLHTKGQGTIMYSYVLLVFPQMSKVQRCTLCPSGLSTKGLLYLCPDDVPESVPHPPGPSPVPATRDSCLRCLPHPCRHRVYIVSPQSPAGGVLWLSAGDATCLGICKGDKYDKIHLEKKSEMFNFAKLQLERPFQCTA